MTLFPRLGTHWPFRYSLLVKMYSFLIPKYQGLDESLISSFELSDDSSGSYFRFFMTEVCGPNPEDTALIVNLADYRNQRMMAQCLLKSNFNIYL